MSTYFPHFCFIFLCSWNKQTPNIACCVIKISESFRVFHTAEVGLFLVVLIWREARGAAVDRGSALQTGISWVPFPIMSSDIFIDIILPAALA
jgi:hypothetical protein